MERHGYQVTTAANEELVVEAVRDNKEKLAAVILDLTMLAIGGWLLHGQNILQETICERVLPQQVRIWKLLALRTLCFPNCFAKRLEVAFGVRLAKIEIQFLIASNNIFIHSQRVRAVRPR